MKALLTLIIGLSLVLTSFGGPTNDTTAASGKDLLTRSYKISAETFIHNLKLLEPPKDGESNQELVVRFFKDNHVEIEKSAGIFLDEKKDKLHIRTTKTDQDKIDRLISKLMNMK